MYKNRMTAIIDGEGNPHPVKKKAHEEMVTFEFKVKIPKQRSGLVFMFLSLPSNCFFPIWNDVSND